MKKIEEIVTTAIAKVREMEGNPSDLRISNMIIFPETWGSTALGFSGMMGGSAMTTEYSTCIKVGEKWYCFFGNWFAYKVSDEFIKEFIDKKELPDTEFVVREYDNKLSEWWWGVYQKCYNAKGTKKESKGVRTLREIIATVSYYSDKFDMTNFDDERLRKIKDMVKESLKKSKYTEYTDEDWNYYGFIEDKDKGEEKEKEK